MALTHASVRRFNRQEYYRLAETVLGPQERVELIEGEIVTLPAHNLPHSVALTLGTSLLVHRFGGTHLVRVQNPLTLSQECEPEPDFALVTPTHFEECARRDEHPCCPDLVIEVADTSLSYDRNEKASLYARAAIPEYWILNLRRRCWEVRQGPAPDPDAPYGHSYKSLRLVAEGEALAPAFAPQTSVQVAGFMRPATA